MTAAPMPLTVAADLLFPHGGVTKATLLAEIRKGRLGFEKIGNRYMVTEADVDAWRKQCRDRKSPPASGSGHGRAVLPNTSSSTPDESTALAAVKVMSAALKKRLRATSRGSTAQTPANVIRLKSPLPTPLRSISGTSRPTRGGPT